jgi:uncharacterized protein DUF3515
VNRWATAGRAALFGTVLVLVVAGCGSDAPQPGPDAGAPACTALLKRLPAQVLDRQRTDLDVAGAAAWGDPPIVLRCGVPPTGPTTDRCLEVGGLDWTFTETKDAFQFVTYGRTPAVEVRLPTSIDRTSAPGALVDLAASVSAIPKTASCV